MDENSTDLVHQTCTIAAAFVGKNSIAPVDIPALIAAIHQALQNAANPQGALAPAVTKLTPAQIRRSITPDALISFEDGRPYRVIKRHLTARGMTIAEYKAKWGLPHDYPTTTANYSALRSQVAKASGLGLVRQAPAPAPKIKNGTKAGPKAPAPAPKPKAKARIKTAATLAAPPARRARAKKAAALEV